ncbi:MAG: hypothetical protein KME30_15010 [Iphinoe sp. HA4291-MV1]|jgi:hypothetical protein|nr:hypothetical protein [Iphinoe sp. HA4291-MV1]
MGVGQWELGNGQGVMSIPLPTGFDHTRLWGRFIEYCDTSGSSFAYQAEFSLPESCMGACTLRRCANVGIGHWELGNGNRVLPLTHYPLPITHCPLPIAHCPLPKSRNSHELGQRMVNPTHWEAIACFFNKLIKLLYCQWSWYRVSCRNYSL